MRVIAVKTLKLYGKKKKEADAKAKADEEKKKKETDAKTKADADAKAEADKKKLGAEVLTLNKEINLIINFSEKLARTIDAPSICKITLDEARHVRLATVTATIATAAAAYCAFSRFRSFVIASRMGVSLPYKSHLTKPCPA